MQVSRVLAYKSNPQMYNSTVAPNGSNPQNLQGFNDDNQAAQPAFGAGKVVTLLGALFMSVTGAFAQNAKPIIHAVDSFGIKNSSKSVKLIVAGKDSTTFNRIAGHIHEGNTKFAADVTVYDPVRNRITIVKRNGDRGDFVEIKPGEIIEDFLTGKGKNQNGEPVLIDKETNISIQELYP